MVHCPKGGLCDFLPDDIVHDLAVYCLTYMILNGDDSRFTMIELGIIY